MGWAELSWAGLFLLARCVVRISTLKYFPFLFRSSSYASPQFFF